MDIPDVHACLFAGTHRWGSHMRTHRLRPWWYTAVLTDPDRDSKGRSSCCLISSPLPDKLGLGWCLGVHGGAGQSCTSWSGPETDELGACGLEFNCSAILLAPLQLPARSSAPPARPLPQPMPILQSFLEIKIFLVLSEDGVDLGARYYLHG